MGKTKKTTGEDLSGGFNDLIDSSLFPNNISAEKSVEGLAFEGGEEIDENELPSKFRKNKENEEDVVEEEIEEEIEEEELEDEIEEEDEEEEIIEEPKKKTKSKKQEVVEEEVEEGDEEESTVSLFFDAIAEEAGWSFDDESEKPKTPEDLIEYFKGVIEENSKPEYADERIARLDEFVKSGGKFEEFYKVESGDIDYENVDVTNEDNQRKIVADFLEAKGFNQVQINKKLDKYEGAGILEDEAEDALEALRDIKIQEKEELLRKQKEEKKAFEEQQTKFYTSVVNQIENLEDIRGIAIKKSDKKQLLDYIFRIEPDGSTKYQKDYAKSTKNLIESAYFTMKGDSLISSAKKAGETSATTRFRNSLTTTKIKGTKTKLPHSAPRPIWESVSL